MFLTTLNQQTHQLDLLVVVDNDPSNENRAIVNETRAGSLGEVIYVPMDSNMGPAGALAAGTKVAGSRIQNQSDSWVVFFDDDDPPPSRETLQDLNLLARIHALDSRVGGVGITGSRYDSRLGKAVRISSGELVGSVRVDWIGGGQFPAYRLKALLDVGGVREDFFFGFDDLEIGLRLKRAGYVLCVDGTQYLRARIATGTVGDKQRINYLPPMWRRYYSVRNSIVVQRTYGSRIGLWRLVFRSVLLHSAYWLVRSPSRGLTNLRYNVLAAVDGLLGRMGRRVLPS